MLYWQRMKLVHLVVVWFPGRIDRNPDVIDALPLIRSSISQSALRDRYLFLKSTPSPTLTPEPAAVSMTQAAGLPERYIPALRPAFRIDPDDLFIRSFFHTTHN